MSRNLHLLRGADLLLLMHPHLSVFRHELEEAIFDLDNSHVLMGVFKDISEVLGVTTAIVGHTNHLINQLKAGHGITDKVGHAKCVRLSALYFLIHSIKVVHRDFPYFRL